MGIDAELTQKIKDIEERGNKALDKLKESKTKFNNAMIKCIGAVTGKNYSDLKEDPAFRRYKTKHSSATVKDWLKTLSTAEKVELLVEYSIDDELNGKNVYEKDLKDAQEAKDDTKIAIKLEVKGIKEDFKELIEQHNEDIKELKDLIERKENERKEYVMQLTELSRVIKNKDGTIRSENGESAKRAKEQIDRITEELDTNPGYKTKLETLKKDAKEYENTIKTKIAELEQKFREEGIEINEEVEAEMESSESRNSSQQSAQDLTNSVSQTQSGNSQDNIDMYSGKPVDVARRMIDEFKELSPEGQRHAVKYGAYEDLLKMTRSLNLWDAITGKKKKIRDAMENRIDDLGGCIDLDCLFNENGERVDLDGWKVNENGELINDRGDLIDQRGRMITKRYTIPGTEIVARSNGESGDSRKPINVILANGEYAIPDDATDVEIKSTEISYELNGKKIKLTIENNELFDKNGTSYGKLMKKNDPVKGRFSISKEELLKLGEMGDKNLDRIVQQMNYYSMNNRENYENMTPAQRRKANETMEILKMVMLIKESKRGAIRRALFNMNRKRARITELGNTLTDFANSAGERDIAAYDKSKKLREMLHIKVNPGKSKVKNGMDASTKTIFQRKTNRGQER